MRSAAGGIGHRLHLSGDQRLLKRLNRMALVRLVKGEPGLSRVDLAGRAGLTKATVGTLVQELIDEGWLRQGEGQVGPGAGRRPLPLAIDAERLGLIGAEVGVDYLNVVATSLQGDLLASRLIAYSHVDARQSARSLAALIVEAYASLSAKGRRVLGIGVGVPSWVDVRTGALSFAPNIGWKDVPFERLIEASLRRTDCGKLGVLMMNEARAGALSECVFGGGELATSLVYLSMGGGLGAGVVLQDRIHEGPDGLAGDVGHTILQRDGPLCTCGLRGCAETFISQRAVSRVTTGREKPLLSLDELVTRIWRGDPKALRGAREAGEYLGILLHNVAATVNPAVIVLGGPLCRLGDPFVQTAFQAMRRLASKYDPGRVSLRQSRFGQIACAVGAAGAVFQRFLQFGEIATSPPSTSSRPLPRRNGTPASDRKLEGAARGSPNGPDSRHLPQNRRRGSIPPLSPIRL
jgi:predicted NBD/HSP70 family sugar kinase